MDADGTNPAFSTSDGQPGPTSSAIAEILGAFRQGERFLVCSHSRPDGDAVGSMLAMGMLLEQMGKRADLVAADRIPSVYRNLPGAQSIRTALRVHGCYDAVILLECDSLERSRLRGLEKFFLINMDHHASGRAFAHLNWIDRDAASAGELVYRMVQAAEAVVTPQMATCLYVTVLTDTGGFCYGATRASTFDLAQKLVLAGADPIRIAQDVYFSAGCVLFHGHLQTPAAGRGALQPEARGPARLALGFSSRHGAHLRRRRGLRGHCQLCPFHRGR